MRNCFDYLEVYRATPFRPAPKILAPLVVTGTLETTNPT